MTPLPTIELMKFNEVDVRDEKESSSHSSFGCLMKCKEILLSLKNSFMYEEEEKSNDVTC
jgi:hypothetical protein